MQLMIAAACFLQLGVGAHAWGQEGKAPRTKASKPAPAKPAPATPPAAIPATHEVARGDTLFRIAAKTRYPGVTLNQMVLALYRANPDAFLEGNINQLVVGRVLTVPGREAVVTVDPAQASRQLRALIAKPVVPVPPPIPPAKEAPIIKPRPEPPPKPVARPPVLTPDLAAARYQQGLQSERSGDMRAAMKAYVEAAESGDGAAQKRLGDIYNTGNAVVERDYETALKWYQKARAQGVEIPKPFTNPGVRH